jgi:hypothetical protein
MNFKALSAISVFLVAAYAGCVVKSDHPADSAPNTATPPAAATVPPPATATPTTTTTTTTATPTPTVAPTAKRPAGLKSAKPAAVADAGTD